MKLKEALGETCPNCGRDMLSDNSGEEAAWESIDAVFKAHEAAVDAMVGELQEPRSFDPQEFLLKHFSQPISWTRPGVFVTDREDGWLDRVREWLADQFLRLDDWVRPGR